MSPPLRVPIEVVQRARVRLEDERTRFDGTASEAGGEGPRSFGGIARVEATTRVVDQVMAALAAAAEEALRAAGRRPEVAMVGLGGYGRSELAPRSDIDLLFLVLDDGETASSPIEADDEVGRPTRPGSSPGRAGPEDVLGDPGGEAGSGPAAPAPPPNAAAEFVEAILYALWDLGLEVGHSVHTPDSALAWAESEQQVLTSLLDARLLSAGAGGAFAREAAFDYVQKGIDDLLSHSEVAKELLAAKRREAERREARYGETVFLLEPNVKESAGGLRDLHMALWSCRVRFKTHGLDELLRLGVLSPEEHRTLRRAYDFVLRVRYELHRIRRRRQDHLRFDSQERIAEILGYAVPGEESHDRKKHGVERFMRAYYFHARHLRILGSALVARATQVRAIRGVQGRPAPGGFRQWGGMITVTSADQFVNDPSALVRIFEVAEDEKLDIHPHTQHLLSEHRGVLDRVWRRDRRVVEPFLSLLENPKIDGSVLEQMHDLGILRQVIPELGRVTARWQHSLYHVYTVDAHVLKVLGFAKRFRQGEFREGLPSLTRMMEDLPRPCVLYLACILHDIGKGWPREDHSRRGAKVATEVGRRLEAAGTSAWDAEDTADLVWLVDDHLVMSDLSQRRDVSDPELVAAFAERVRTEERLEMLYLLTVCDMMGTSPSVWTNWKGTLLRELFLNARAALRSDDGAGARHHLAERRKRAEAALLSEMAEDPRAQAAARAFFAAVPDRYLLSVSTSRMARHVRMWSGVRRRGGLATHVTHHRRDGVSRLTVACPDRPALLSSVAGALASADLSIISASVFSIPPPPVELTGDLDATLGPRDFSFVPDAPSESSVALDLFYVTDARGQLCDDPDRWARVRTRLQKVLVEGEPLDRVVRGVFGSSGLEPHRPAVKTEVEIVASGGEEAVVDVFCEDHVGVLYLIARTLADLGLVISLAKISTQGHRVADGFYVVDAASGRAPDADRLRAAAVALRAALDGRRAA